MPIFAREHIQFHPTYCEQVCHCFLGWVGFSEQEISGLKLRTVWGNWGKMISLNATELLAHWGATERTKPCVSSSLRVQFCSSWPSSQSQKPSQTRGPRCRKMLALQAGLAVTVVRDRKVMNTGHQLVSLMTSSIPLKLWTLTWQIQGSDRVCFFLKWHIPGRKQKFSVTPFSGLVFDIV